MPKATTLFFSRFGLSGKKNICLTAVFHKKKKDQLTNLDVVLYIRERLSSKVAGGDPTMVTVFFQSVISLCTRVWTVMRVLVDGYPTVGRNQHR